MQFKKHPLAVLISALVALILIQPLSAHATPVVMDFNSVDTEIGPGNASYYDEDGFRLKSNRGENNVSGTLSWCADCDSPAQVFTVQRIDAQPFSFLSLDVKGLSGDTPLSDTPPSIKVIGFPVGGGMVMQTFNIAMPTMFETFVLGPGFGNLLSAQFTQGFLETADCCGRDFEADNLVFHDPKGIPEPGTLALFGLGLAGLGFARRRKAA